MTEPTQTCEGVRYRAGSVWCRLFGHAWMVLDEDFPLGGRVCRRCSVEQYALVGVQGEDATT